jgi:glycosyltransferase involved in cell wall biosynthesis
MKVLIVSGIWPPDVGGPASHAPEVASYLLEQGHEPHVVVTADAVPAQEQYPVDWVARSSPPGVRHTRALTRVATLARDADVVYTTGMFGRSGLGSLLARRPYVVKLTADPAFERARRRGLTGASLAEFQLDRQLRTLPLRRVRQTLVRRASHVVTPSSYLRDLALGWGAGAVTVLPNPAPSVEGLPSREDLRRRFELAGPTLVFAGRLAPQKSLELAIESARSAGVALVIAGDGPERTSLERLGHARFLGPLPRHDVLSLLRAADASILSSSWENFPHGIVESLAVGTPAVATDVGGVAEILRDGENGLLVPPADPVALTTAIKRLFGEPELLPRLRAAAAASVADYSRERVYGHLLDILAAAAAR